MDYDEIRHAVKTGDKILELARSLDLDPETCTIMDLANVLLENAVRKSGPEQSA